MSNRLALKVSTTLMVINKASIDMSAAQLMICSHNYVPGPSSKIYYPVPNSGYEFPVFSMTIILPIFGSVFAFFTTLRQ